MLLYHGLFGSLLSYGIIVWGQTYPSLTEKYIYSSKKVVRVIDFNSKIAFSTPIFDKLQVLKQEHIFQLQLSSFVYESINISPEHFQNYFNKIPNIHQISTRQAVRGDLFVEHRSTIQYGVRFIQYLGARIWNDFPLLIRNSPSMTNFKKTLKIHFLSTCRQVSS